MLNDFFFSKIVPFVKESGKNIVRVGQASHHTTTHAHCMQDTNGYRHTLRICNNYCFFPFNNCRTNVSECCVIRTLPVLFTFIYTVKVKVTPLHVTGSTDRTSELHLYPRLTPALDGVGCQHQNPAALVVGNRPVTQCAGGRVGPTDGLNRCGQVNISYPYRI